MSAVAAKPRVGLKVTGLLLAAFVGAGFLTGWQTTLAAVASGVYLTSNVFGAVPLWGWGSLVMASCLLWMFGRLDTLAGALFSIGFIGMIGAASVAFEENVARRCLGTQEGTASYFAGRVILERQGDCSAPVIVAYRVSPPVSWGGFERLVRHHGVHIGKSKYLPGIVECYGFLDDIKRNRGGLADRLLLNGVPVAKAACAWHRQNAISIK